jgi:hypothetical protein
VTVTPADGVFVAVAVVTLLQYARHRERTMLPLALLFVLLAGAATREWWDPWQDWFKLAAAAAGLWQLALLSRRAAVTNRDRPPR